MKKLLVRLTLAAAVVGVVLVARRIMLDLSESEDLWNSITDEVDEQLEATSSQL